jgi:hypothetical protein
MDNGTGSAAVTASISYGSGAGSTVPGRQAVSGALNREDAAEDGITPARPINSIPEETGLSSP